MIRRLRTIVAAVAVGLGAPALSACAAVPAYERETLAHPAMRDGADPEGDAMRAHVAGAREAALDPGESGGGGCGCN